MPRKSSPVPPAARPAAVPRPYHHGNLRAALVEAATAVLDERGPGAVSLRDVARVAGVSHAAPYHHFAGLDELLAAVAQQGFDELQVAIAATAGTVDTRERLLRIAQVYVDCALAQPQRFRLMFGPLLGRGDEFPALATAARRAFALVDAAARAHDSRHGAELATASWSLTHGLSHLLIEGALQPAPATPAAARALARRLAARLLG